MWKNSHLLSLSFRLFSQKCLNTTCKHQKCSSSVLEKTIMSSKYIKHYVKFSLPRQFCINLWNVAGALHNPKGMRSNSKILRSPPQRLYTVLMLCPWWSAKNLLSGLSRKNIQPLQDSQWPLVCRAMDKNLFLSSHSVC